jgi:3-phenylpropionate/trans-cinnamate dioxygenase ferredoxin reductase component
MLQAPDTQTFVIVGAGLAGVTATFALRDEGFTGNIVLIGAEPQAPYERPPLSKKYLKGDVQFEELRLRPESHFAEKNIETCFGSSVDHIDTQSQTLNLSNGESICYDKLLIATGTRNRKLKIPGADLAGVCDLRELGDADRIRQEAQSGRKAVLVGMGFIGSEVAATLQQLGVNVTIVEPQEIPFAQSLGKDIGRLLTDIHRERGVVMHFGEFVVGLEGDSTGRVKRVITHSGLQLDCDFVVVGIGVEPVTDFLAGTGVKLENGIVVNEYCQTNVPNIFAAGDVANHYHPLPQKHIRVEHYQNAISQGTAAAKNMLGKQDIYQEVHWLWSDQYEYNLQYGGFQGAWDTFVVRGSFEARDFIGFYLQGNTIQAAVSMNRSKDMKLSLRLIEKRVAVSASDLQDENVNLKGLLKVEGVKV